MTIARERLRWNGWGWSDTGFGLSAARERALLEALGRRLGRPVAKAPPPVALDDVRLPPTKLPADVLTALRSVCGEDGVATTVFERVSHAAGRSLPDLLRLRRGEVDPVPEAVVYPPDEGAVAAVLRLASEAHLAVVPFGGGTSVVGGVAPAVGPGQLGAISLDTTRLDGLVRLDRESGTACFQAGIDGPALEAALARHGFTLGHFPQSFEHSTLGGWIATRSCGQQSDGYGGIARLLVSVRMVTPQGVIRTVEVPHSAAGPDLNQIVLGSEGVLGVIVEATLRVRPLPRVRDYRALLFRSFEAGVETARAAVREGLPVSLMRLSDAGETELSLLLRHDPARRLDLAARFLSLARAWGYREGRCLLLYGAEGESAARVHATARRLRALARARGGLPLGRGPGRAWQRERFRTPYLRDWLLDYGVAVDTFETALPWSRLQAGHDAILRALRGALESHAGTGLAMAHLSHSYPDGACLYFTMLYPVDASRDVAQWQAIKRDVTEAVLEAGGTLSHHHGVGRDHAPWIVREKGALGVEALRALKQAVDPEATLNPGKLL